MTGAQALARQVALRTRARRLERQVASATILVPTLAAALAIALAARGVVPSRLTLILAAALYAITILGITAGFHRLFTHAAFRAGPVLRIALGIAASMAAQGPLLYWVATHRQHHQESDGPRDPHSPSTGTLWHAHLAWMFEHEPPNLGRYARELLRAPDALFVSRWYFGWVALGIALPALVVFACERSIGAALLAALWAGGVRIFLAHHATWAVNSLCHAVGRRPFHCRDRSANLAPVALFTFGEGWHNNHHAFPSSARLGLRRGELDLGYAAIWLFARCGLASEVKVPSAQQRAFRAAAHGRSLDGIA